METGIAAYKMLINALLDITDNLDAHGNIVTPPDVLRPDGDDPYLVVAADKGTATFSDIANGIALERGGGADLQTMFREMIAEPLGLFDCCGVSDGAAAAIVTTPEIARALGKRDLVTIKAIQLSISSGIESTMSSWDGSFVRNTRTAAKRAYHEAGITDPRKQLSMMEVHDCFSITELVTMEDLFVADEGRAVHDVLDGFFDRDGGVPCQIDGGLKCFGHPVAASGLRMAYECYNQLLGRAGARQIASPSLALMHILGGVPYQGIAAISIFGLHG